MRFNKLKTETETGQVQRRDWTEHESEKSKPKERFLMTTLNITNGSSKAKYEEIFQCLKHQCNTGMFKSGQVKVLQWSNQSQDLNLTKISGISFFFNC